MDRHGSNDPTCPFCPFSDMDGNFVAQHVQYCHPENGLQAEQQGITRANNGVFSKRQMPDVYETGDEPTSKHASLSHSLEEEDMELEEYFAFEHSLPRLQKDRTGDRVHSHYVSRQATLRNGDQNDRSQRTSSTKASNENGKRLGRSELGPYAHEKRMPLWLLKMLEKGNAASRISLITPNGRLSRRLVVENQTSNVVPALAHLCGQDKSVQRAFFCSTRVHQISKMPREGSFCGYRNIQMLVSYLQESRGPGHDPFPGALPTILQLQDMIEHAWDMGFNTVGRAETGGIKGTRKYIGTSEAQALFLSLGIGCEASSIAKTDRMPAHSALLSQVVAYFRSACPLDKNEKVVLTNLPPVYLQHHGHSMTIIGFEIRDKGHANLLVFDPTYKTPVAIKHSTATTIKSPDPARILKGYRRGGEYLQKYQNFEILKLSPPGIPPENQ
ncbi:peptidase family C78-domain-containing protein [Aspergillus carlsbadensis]|nr:peptidase family C78-domain-containing protein [Aspergillus carlsbadensis]